jgi:hypothetical protein
MSGSERRWFSCNATSRGTSVEVRAYSSRVARGSGDNYAVVAVRIVVDQDI